MSVAGSVHLAVELVLLLDSYLAVAWALQLVVHSVAVSVVESAAVTVAGSAAA